MRVDIVKNNTEEGLKTLHSKCEKVPSPITDGILSFCHNILIPTMLEYNGIGISAPQVGSNARIIVMNTQKNGPVVLINPSIIKHNGIKVLSKEGCLSCPGQTGMVLRYQKVLISANTLDNKKIKQELNGLSSFVIQHEIDHLNGILFVDKLVYKGKNT